jgi:hypothetical protein
VPTVPSGGTSSRSTRVPARSARPESRARQLTSDPSDWPLCGAAKCDAAPVLACPQGRGLFMLTTLIPTDHRADHGGTSDLRGAPRSERPHPTSQRNGRPSESSCRCPRLTRRAPASSCPHSSLVGKLPEAGTCPCAGPGTRAWPCCRRRPSPALWIRTGSRVARLHDTAR